MGVHSGAGVPSHRVHHVVSADRYGRQPRPYDAVGQGGLAGHPYLVPRGAQRPRQRYGAVEVSVHREGREQDAHRSSYELVATGKRRTPRTTGDRIRRNTASRPRNFWRWVASAVSATSASCRTTGATNPPASPPRRLR